MKIVLQSRAYWPNIGGIETVARLLAEDFNALGHSTLVLTDTPAAEEASPGVTVLRRTTLGRRVAALREADVVLMFGLGLRFLPLPLLLRRPTVVSHHGVYGGWRPAVVLKRCVPFFTRNIAATAAVARSFGGPATVIPNPYDDALFRERPEIERSRDLVFVGRLVSEKGLDVLVAALALLAQAGFRPSLTVIGSGPEEARCRQAVVTCGLDRQVLWAGSLLGEALATALNGHRVLVVPSLVNEGFGVVALEGLASGCVVVGSDGGGLPEAIGPGGRTFPNGDVRALADALRATLEAVEPPPRAAVRAHLAGHARRFVAQRYLEVLRDAAHR